MFYFPWQLLQNFLPFLRGEPLGTRYFCSQQSGPENLQSTLLGLHLPSSPFACPYPHLFVPCHFPHQKSHPLLCLSSLIAGCVDSQYTLIGMSVYVFPLPPGFLCQASFFLTYATLNSLQLISLSV